MANTVVAGVLDKIVSASIPTITRKVYRDPAPEKVDYPFVSVRNEGPGSSVFSGDGAAIYRQRTVMLDVWQKRGVSFNPQLPISVSVLFERAQLVVGAQICFVRVDGIQEIDDSDRGIMRTEVSLLVNTPFDVA